jgi:short-subunit dehydrogenase
MTPVSPRDARVLVTGATGGIGGAIARRFAQEGSSLLLTGRRQDALDALARELGGDAFAADLTSREEVARLLAAAGTIDVLVANAAMPASGRLSGLDQAGVDRAIEVNLRAPIALAHGLIPGMAQRGRGHLVFIGSLAGRAATSGACVYNATKFGLRGFALALHAELASAGIGVSLIAPGFVSAAGMYADSNVTLPRGIATRTPEQVADAVLRAIAGNLAEVDVAPLTMRLGADFAGLAPSVAARLTRALGGDRIAARFEAAQADKR